MFTIKTHRRNPMAMNITFMTSSFWNIRLRPWGFRGCKAKYEKNRFLFY